MLAGLGAGGYGLARRQAREGRAWAELEQWRTALDEYRVEHGRYPAAAAPTGIGALPEAGWLARAVDAAAAIDPWGRAYRYVCTNRFLYTLWSQGQDADSQADDIGPNPGGY